MAFERILAEEINFYELYGRRLVEDRITAYPYIDDANEISEELYSAISDIIRSFDDFTFSTLFNDSSEDIWLLVTGYLFRYGAHGAGLLLSRTRDAMNTCLDLRRVSLASQVNVVSLGGGPGNCMIGFCSALYEVKDSIYKANPHPRQRLNLTVVDSVKSWEDCVTRTNNAARDPDSDYGNISSLYRNNDVHMQFCHADLCDTWNGRLLSALREADIILMPKLMSVMKGNIENAKRENAELIQELSRELKPNALLLLVDSLTSPRIPEDSIWEQYFEILHSSDLEAYQILREFETRFGHRGSSTSKAQIRVYRKKIE